MASAPVRRSFQSKRLGYAQPPAASPFSLRDLYQGARGLREEKAALSRFRRELRTYFDVHHVSLMSTARAGLAVALQAMHKLFPERKKVIIPAFTCWVVPAAVVRAGLVPLPCDMGEHSFDYDYSLLSGMLGPDVLGVVAQHIFGIPADMDRLRQMLQGSGIFLLEDAAQAMGGMAGGRLLGTLGDVGLLSLGRGKNLSTVQGGILMTNNEEIAAAVNEVGQGIGPCPRKENLEILFQAAAMSCFLHPRLFWIPANLPWVRLGETYFDLTFPISRLGGVQAGLAHNWVARLKSFCRVRQANAQVLLTAVPQLKAICPTLPGLAGYGSRLPIFMADDFAREALITESWEKGLGIALTYPDAVDGIPYFRQALWHGTFPQARRLCKETVTLPIHPLMAATDLERIINLLHRFW